MNVAGRGRPRPRYVNFEHAQNIRSEVVVKKERTGSVVRSWEERRAVGYCRIEVVAQSY